MPTVIFRKSGGLCGSLLKVCGSLLKVYGRSERSMEGLKGLWKVNEVYLR